MKANKLIFLFIAECQGILIRNHRKLVSKEYADNYLDGVYSVFCLLTSEFDMTKVFSSKKPTKAQQKKYASYENESIQLMRIFKVEGYDEIAIFNDDYGQCFAALINDKLQGLGTYNLNICLEVYRLVLDDLLEKYKKELI